MNALSALLFSSMPPPAPSYSSPGRGGGGQYHNAHEDTDNGVFTAGDSSDPLFGSEASSFQSRKGKKGGAASHYSSLSFASAAASPSFAFLNGRGANMRPCTIAMIKRSLLPVVTDMGGGTASIYGGSSAIMGHSRHGIVVGGGGGGVGMLSDFDAGPQPLSYWKQLNGVEEDDGNGDGTAAVGAATKKRTVQARMSDFFPRGGRGTVSSSSRTAAPTVMSPLYFGFPLEMGGGLFRSATVVGSIVAIRLGAATKGGGRISSGQWLAESEGFVDGRNEGLRVSYGGSGGGVAMNHGRPVIHNASHTVNDDDHGDDDNVFVSVPVDHQEPQRRGRKGGGGGQWGKKRGRNNADDADSAPTTTYTHKAKPPILFGCPISEDAAYAPIPTTYPSQSTGAGEGRSDAAGLNDSCPTTPNLFYFHNVIGGGGGAGRAPAFDHNGGPPSSSSSALHRPIRQDYVHIVTITDGSGLLDLVIPIPLLSFGDDAADNDDDGAIGEGNGEEEKDMAGRGERKKTTISSSSTLGELQRLQRLMSGGSADYVNDGDEEEGCYAETGADYREIASSKTKCRRASAASFPPLTDVAGVPLLKHDYIHAVVFPSTELSSEPSCCGPSATAQRANYNGGGHISQNYNNTAAPSSPLSQLRPNVPRVYAAAIRSVATANESVHHTLSAMVTCKRLIMTPHTMQDHHAHQHGGGEASYAVCQHRRGEDQEGFSATAFAPTNDVVEGDIADSRHCRPLSSGSDRGWYDGGYDDDAHHESSRRPNSKGDRRHQRGCGTTFPATDSFNGEDPYQWAAKGIGPARGFTSEG